MRPLHFLAALAVVVIWGFNFVVIKIGLTELPPLLMCALRFFLAAFPAVFFIARPRVSLGLVALYGLLMFALQFALLFVGMYLGVSAGLAALCLQVHVFITMALASLFLGERLSPIRIAGAVIAFAGIGIVGVNIGGDVTFVGLALVLLAACAWGLANLVSKKIGQVDMLALIVWGSLAAPLPLLGLSFLLEGWDRIVAGVMQMSWVSIWAVSYIVYPTTLVGFSVWSWLLSRYPASTVAPVTLLVPVVGLASSVVVLGEPLQSWKIAAAGLVCLGIGINMLGPRLVRYGALARVRPH